MVHYYIKTREIILKLLIRNIFSFKINSIVCLFIVSIIFFNMQNSFRVKTIPTNSIDEFSIHIFQCNRSKFSLSILVCIISFYYFFSSIIFMKN